MKNWIALALALASLAAAALLLSILPASDCSERQLPDLLRASIPGAVYALAGGYVVWNADREQRLALFLGSLLIAAGYVAALRMTLPMIVRTEPICAPAGGAMPPPPPR
jgi:cytochrome bd-type quinol oxidase subunit 2